jgi:sterol 3beta-glucosyltransferase
VRVLIATVGSRGDVAPFTGLGRALQAAGHQVTVATYGMFAGLVSNAGLGFRALPGDPRLLEAARWQRGGTGPLGAARLTRLIAGHMREVHAGVLEATRQDVDVLLAVNLVAIGGFHIAQGLGIPSMGLVLAPVNPTREFAPSVLTARSLGHRGNLAAGQVLVALGSPMLGGPVGDLRAELGLPRISRREAVFGQQDAVRWPVFHGFSPSVVPRPADWRAGIEVAGYWWPASPTAWQPPAALEEFLAAGPPPVFIGIGSMTPCDAGRLAGLAGQAGRAAGARMVIQQLQPGSPDAEPLPSGTSILLGEVPHDWLFPRMAAVIHHAGAGTTAAGLRAGVPGVGVPMLGDQPFWAARLAALGCGPPPIPYRRLTFRRLTAAIRDVANRPYYREQARAVAAKLASEDGAAPVISALESLPR